MNKKINKSKTIFLFAIIFIIVLFLINSFTENGLIKNINLNVLKEDEINTENFVTCKLYDNQNAQALKALIKIQNDNEIDYVIKPDGQKVFAYGLKQLAFDIITQLDANNILKIKLKNNSDIITKNVVINEEFIENLFTVTDVSTDNISAKIKMNWNDRINTDTFEYKIGNGNWNNYTGGEVSLNLGHAADTASATNGKVTIYMRKTDNGNNTVIASKTIDINSRIYDPFAYLINTGKSLNYYFDSNIAGSESGSPSYYNLPFGHGTYHRFMVR